jgi:hypothetical protein
MYRKESNQSNISNNGTQEFGFYSSPPENILSYNVGSQMDTMYSNPMGATVHRASFDGVEELLNHAQADISGFMNSEEYPQTMDEITYHNNPIELPFAMNSIPMHSGFNFEDPQITRSHASSMNIPQMVNSDSRNDSFSASQYLMLEPRTESFSSGRPQMIIQDPRSLAFVNQTRSASFSSSPQAVFVQADDQNLQEIEAHMEQNYLANMYPGNMQGFNGNPYPIDMPYIQGIPNSMPLNTLTIDEEQCDEVVSYDSDSKDFRILSNDIESLSADASYFKVDPSFQWENFVSDPDRRATIIRWKQKKADLLKPKAQKANQYQVRVDVANRRPRVKGRFLPSNNTA